MERQICILQVSKNQGNLHILGAEELQTKGKSQSFYSIHGKAVPPLLSLDISGLG